MTSRFQKRHYEATAEVLQKQHPSFVFGDRASAMHFDQWNATVRAFGQMFKADNYAKFQYDRFITACQPGNNVRARS